MATQVACPACGTPMREIVWGYGTIADVADAGDAVIGGCVVDVDAAGRAAALQCPACGTRADAQGVALERPAPPAPAEHPFAVAFSSSTSPNEEVTMQDEPSSSGEPDRDGAQSMDEAQSMEGSRAANRPYGTSGADALPYVEEDFGGIASGGDWREHVEPYASREVELPEASPPAPARVDPYASREDALPERSAAAAARVDPYASREDALPPAWSSAPDRVGPYASPEGPLPTADGRGWRDRVDPFAPDGPGTAATGDVRRDDRTVDGRGDTVPREGA